MQAAEPPLFGDDGIIVPSEKQEDAIILFPAIDERRNPLDCLTPIQRSFRDRQVLDRIQVCFESFLYMSG